MDFQSVGGAAHSFQGTPYLTECLDWDQTAALIGVHHLWYQTLAHYHLDRLLIPPPAAPPSSHVLLFLFQCVSPPVDLPPPLLPSCQGRLVLYSGPSPWGDNARAPTPAACSKHFSERCHRSSTRKLLFMIHAPESTHCTTSQTLNREGDLHFHRSLLKRKLETWKQVALNQNIKCVCV